MDFNRFFDVFYWFNFEPNTLSLRTAFFWFSFFAFFIVLKFLGKIVVQHYKKELLAPEKRLLSKTESMFLTMGFAGIAWTFFAYEGLPIISARFWMIVWLVSFVLWAYIIAHYALVEVPPLLRDYREKEKREKYLPKKKS